jgi:hypothetical protein
MATPPHPRVGKGGDKNDAIQYERLRPRSSEMTLPDLR